MRLIDADKYQFPGDLINEPTIDAVPVVRCRECKHGHTFIIGLSCSNGPWKDSLLSPDDFCSYGERRDDDGR